MTLETQVCSLDLSRRLKDLGVKQESAFVWYTNAVNAHLLYLGEDGMRPMEAKTYSAFTVAELGEMLRPHLQKEVWLSEIAQTMTNARQMEDEANSRAKMLIYLLENSLITPHK